MMRIGLAMCLLAACAHSNRHRIPITGPTPQTRDELAVFIENAKRLGCTYSEVDDDKKPSLVCDRFVGKPRFIFLRDNTVLCGVNQRHDEYCGRAWEELNTPHGTAGAGGS